MNAATIPKLPKEDWRLDRLHRGICAIETFADAIGDCEWLEREMGIELELCMGPIKEIAMLVQFQLAPKLRDIVESLMDDLEKMDAAS